MKKLFLILFVLSLAATGTAYASVGWANYQWPCYGAGYADNQNIDIYSRAWKDGCTAGVGPCADLSATIYYRRATQAPNWTSAAMTYLGDTDGNNNDEFTFQIPASETQAGDDCESATLSINSHKCAPCRRPDCSAN